MLRNKKPVMSVETRCNADLMNQPMRKTNRPQPPRLLITLAFDQEAAAEMKEPPGWSGPTQKSKHLSSRCGSTDGNSE